MAKTGFWQGQFTKPWEWRRSKNLSSDTHNQSDRCQIEGNISKSETIISYLDWSRYEKTNINTDKGDRWFCANKEAQAAGLRERN